MLTHVTVELPKVIEDAGLPIVSNGELTIFTPYRIDAWSFVGFLTPVNLRAFNGRARCTHIVPQLPT